MVKTKRLEIKEHTLIETNMGNIGRVIHIYSSCNKNGFQVEFEDQLRTVTRPEIKKIVSKEYVRKRVSKEQNVLTKCYNTPRKQRQWLI